MVKQPNSCQVLAHLCLLLQDLNTDNGISRI